MIEGLKKLFGKKSESTSENVNENKDTGIIENNHANDSHIDIKYMNGEFVVKGRVNWGFAGTCVKDNFEDDKPISLMIKENVFDPCYYDYMATGLKELFKAETTKIDGEKAAELLTKYYNSVLAELDQCQTQLTNYILYQLISFFWDTAYPFWNTKQAIKAGYGEIDESVYTKELSKAIDEVSVDLNDITDYHGTKTIKDYHADVRGVFEKHLPMFDLEALEKAIVETCCSFDISGISLQFSDDWKKEFFCCAYDKFERELAPIDWHNF